MKKRKPQVTCNCSAYEFPHRVNSYNRKTNKGCHGDQWALSYMDIDGSMCDTCNCLRGINDCDVASGVEDISHCQGYQDHLLSQNSLRLPTTVDEMMEDNRYGYE